MSSTPCPLASQFVASRALASLASALDASATKIGIEKDRQVVILAGLPTLPAESVDGTLANVLGLDIVRLAMTAAKTALTSHIDGLTILLGNVASQREQITRLADTVAPPIPDTPQPAPETPVPPAQPDTPPADPAPVVPVVEDSKPAPKPFTLSGLADDLLKRMAAEEWTPRRVALWCGSRGMEHPGIVPFSAALRDAVQSIRDHKDEQENPTATAANPPASPPPSNGSLFPADVGKIIDTVNESAAKSADANGDQPRPRGNRRSQTRHSAR